MQAGGSAEILKHLINEWQVGRIVKLDPKPFEAGLAVLNRVQLGIENGAPDEVRPILND